MFDERNWDYDTSRVITPYKSLQEYPELRVSVSSLSDGNYIRKLKSTSRSELETVSMKDLISKALQDGQISDVEFKAILDDVERFNTMKEEIYVKRSEISDDEKRS